MHDLILKSRDIIDEAIATFKPMATVFMFSGGDDSLTTYQVLKQLGVKFDFVIHGNTRTGIQETTDFVIKEVERRKDKLIIADAGNAYIDYVLRKGFFGKGNHAHRYSYHVLKQRHSYTFF